MIHDGHAIAQALGFLHEMRSEEDRLAALTDAAAALGLSPFADLRVHLQRQGVERERLGCIFYG